jgi:hypothetical protein
MHVAPVESLSIKLSGQIEQLDELIKTAGDGSEFFERTHITQGMKDLISEGIARLAGSSSVLLLMQIFHGIHLASNNAWDGLSGLARPGSQ